LRISDVLWRSDENDLSVDENDVWRGDWAWHRIIRGCFHASRHICARLMNQFQVTAFWLTGMSLSFTCQFFLDRHFTKNSPVCTLKGLFCLFSLKLLDVGDFEVLFMHLTVTVNLGPNS